MKLSQGELVTERSGLTGTIEAFDEVGRRVTIRFDGHQPVTVPAELLMPQEDGGYRLAFGLEELETAVLGSSDDEAVIPVIREEARVNKRQVETGRVRLAKHVHEREETIDVPLVKEEVEIRRVAVDRIVEGPVPVRQEGDVTVIPLLEEVLVVEKRLLLKEEIHVGKRQIERREPHRVTLRSEEVTVERTNGRGGRPA